MRWWPRVISPFGFCAFIAILYFLFAGQVSRPEFFACILPVAIACSFAGRWAHLSRREFSLAAPWGRILANTLHALPRDTFKVGLVLAGALRHPPAGEKGVLLRQNCRPGGRGRRAILILANSLPPNGFVIRLSSSGMTLHRLAPAKPSADSEWPI